MSSGTHSMPTSERRSSSRLVDAASLRSRLQAGAAGQQLGLLVGEQEHVGLDDSARPRARGVRIRSGTHGWSVGIVSMIGVPSPACWPELGGAGGVEAGGHEDLAAAAVEVEHLGRVGREQEAVVGGPAADLVAAALAAR